ncbi:MAG TPA: diguanylate cyclase, partial [Burkholderiaceae bacterium]
MSSDPAPTPSAEGLAEQLARARAAMKAAQFGEGRQLAEAAWVAARQAGYVGEQIEAGRLCCLFLFRRGELLEMLALAEQILPLLRGPGQGAALCEVLRWCTLAGAEIGEFETAMDAANEGSAMAQELDDVRLRSMALNAMGAVFEAMGDPWQAERLMNEAEALLREQAGPFERVVALNNLWTVAIASFHLLRGTRHEAECRQALQRALHLAQVVRPHTRELGDVFATALNDSHLGEVLLHLGQLDEAGVFLEAAQTSAQLYSFRAIAVRVGCLRAELALARGHADAAQAALARLLLEAPKVSGVDLRPLHHASYRCCKALGQQGAALRHLEAFQALERRRNAAQLVAQSRYMATRVEAARVRADAPQGRENGANENDLRDPLTGLGNRLCMEMRLPGLVQDSEQRGHPLTVALVDLDRFRAINEAHGSEVG